MNETTRDALILVALAGVIFFLSKEVKKKVVLKNLPTGHNAPNKVTKTDSANVGPNTNVAYQTGSTNFEQYEP